MFYKIDKYICFLGYNLDTASSVIHLAYYYYSKSDLLITKQ